MSCESNSRKTAVCAAKAGVSSLASKGAYAAQSAKQSIGNAAQSTKQGMRKNKGAVAGMMAGGAIAGPPGAAVGAAVGKGHQYTLGKVSSALKRRGMTSTALRSAASSRVQSARAEYRQKANAATAPYVAKVRATEAAAQDWVKKNSDQVAGAVGQAKATVEARRDQVGATIKRGAATARATPVGRAAGATAGYAKGVGRNFGRLARAERNMLRSNATERKNIKAARKAYKAKATAYRYKPGWGLAGRTAVNSGVAGGVAYKMTHALYNRGVRSPINLTVGSVVTGVAVGQTVDRAMGNIAWRRSSEGKAALKELKTAKSEATSRYKAVSNEYVQSLKTFGGSLLGRRAGG